MVTSFFIRRKIEALAGRSAGRSRRAVSWEKARSLLVLCDGRDLDTIRRILEPERKEVVFCVYAPHEGGAIAGDDSIIPVSRADLNLWGFPSERLLARVDAVKADLLIDAAPAACYATRYIAMRHSCPFKAGLLLPGQKGYDVGLVATERDAIADLFGQLLFYLRSIRAK